MDPRSARITPFTISWLFISCAYMLPRGTQAMPLEKIKLKEEAYWKLHTRGHALHQRGARTISREGNRARGIPFAISCAFLLCVCRPKRDVRASRVGGFVVNVCNCHGHAKMHCVLPLVAVLCLLKAWESEIPWLRSRCSFCPASSLFCSISLSSSDVVSFAIKTALIVTLVAIVFCSAGGVLWFSSSLMSFSSMLAP